MASNKDRTLVDHGCAGCPDRPAKPDPPQSAYTNGVVTPHAAFLALRYRPARGGREPPPARGDFPGLFGRWGFADSVNVDTGSRLVVLPVAGPGHGDGRARQPARR